MMVKTLNAERRVCSDAAPPYDAQSLRYDSASVYLNNRLAASGLSVVKHVCHCGVREVVVDAQWEYRISGLTRVRV